MVQLETQQVTPLTPNTAEAVVVVTGTAERAALSVEGEAAYSTAVGKKAGWEVAAAVVALNTTTPALAVQHSSWWSGRHLE